MSSILCTETSLWQCRFHDHLATTEALPHAAESLPALLPPFFAVLTQAGVASLAAVQPIHVEAYRTRLLDTPQRPSDACVSPSLRLFAVQAFLRFLRQAGLSATNPGAAVTLPPTKRRGGPLSPLEAEAMLLAPDPATPLGLHDRAVLDLLYRARVSPTHLRRLTVPSSALGLAYGLYLRANRHAALTRIVLAPSTTARLEAYLERGRPHLAGHRPEQTLFLTATGQPLDARALHALVHQAAVATGLPSTTPAALCDIRYGRHSLASAVS